MRTIVNASSSEITDYSVQEQVTGLIKGLLGTYSIKQIADKVGTSYKNVYKWYSKDTTPSTTCYLRLVALHSAHCSDNTKAHFCK